MQVQGASPAQSAPLPAQAISALTAPTATKQSTPLNPTASQEKTTPSAPPAATVTPPPARPVQTAPPAEATQTVLPSKPTVPAPPARTTPQMAVSEPSAPAGSVTTVEEPSFESTPEEVQLTEEIDQLWNAHSRAQGSLRKSREDAAKIRADLSVRLHQLKKVLSRPGRGGAWFSFLKAQAIPRSTADRLVNAHQKTISGVDGNCPTGASEKHEPMEVVVHRYLNGLWPKLSRVLTTREHVEMFIAALTNIAEKSFAAADESSNSPASEDPSPDPAS
jgi:hypothetical protein